MKTPTILIRGKITPTIKIKGKTNASIIKIYPELEKIEVTPTLEDQVVKPEGYGFEEVKVKGVTAYIDEDIKAEYIREGVDILGVVGNYKGIETSDATATPEDILQGKTAYINNEKVEGTIQEYDGSFDGTATTKSEWETIFESSIDDSLGANVTKLPDTTTSIRNNAFNSCTNLSLTKLPDNLVSIGSGAFYYCRNLALSELPEKITEIDNNSFNGCYNITQLNCKGNIKQINIGAFKGCKNLTKFMMPNITTVPKLVNISAFEDTPIANGTGYTYVPDDLVESFKIAINWSTYANQIKGLSEMEE